MVEVRYRLTSIQFRPTIWLLSILMSTCLSTLPLHSAAQSKDEQRIAVLELSNHANLSQAEVNYLSDLLRRLASSELAQEFLVMDKENIITLLPPDRKLEDCVGECAVDTGRLLSAAYIITGEIIKFGPQLRVTVKLHDTQNGRLLASEVASGKQVMDMEVGIQEAGGRLLRRLITRSDQSELGSTERTTIESGKKSKLVGSSRKRVIVTLLSQPPGAGVTIDGIKKCPEGTSDCKVELTEGAHQIRMSKTDYFERSGSITVSRDRRRIEWTLDPNFATLQVETSPPSLTYSIDGNQHTGPHSQRIQLGKSYRVVSADPCYTQVGEEVKAGKAGKVIEVKLTPQKQYAIIDVSARDVAGTPIEADVEVDGKAVGLTPGEFQVWACAQQLKLSHQEHGQDLSRLALKVDERSRHVVTLNEGTKGLPSQRVTVKQEVGAASDSYQLWAWTSLALSGVALGLSIYGYTQASSAKDELSSTTQLDRYQALEDQYESGKQLATIGVNSALIFGVASGLFFLISDPDDPNTQASLIPTSGGAFATYQWDW